AKDTKDRTEGTEHGSVCAPPPWPLFCPLSPRRHRPLAGNDLFERELQVRRLVAREFHGIDPGVTRTAVRAVLRAHRAEHSLETQIGEAVGFEIVADLVERMRRRDQLGLPRRVDAVKAR